MELIVLQILCGTGFCLGVILWTLAPVLLAQRSRSRAPNKHRRERIQYSLSLANCFACGVFLATCFYGMIPHMRRHLQIAVQNSNSSMVEDGFWIDCLHFLNDKPMVEVLLLCGFLLTVFLEELGQLCRRSTTTSKVTRVHPVSGAAQQHNLNGFTDTKSSVSLSILIISEYFGYISFYVFQVNFKSQEEESEPLVSLSDGDEEEINLHDHIPHENEDGPSAIKVDGHQGHHHHHIPALNGSNLSFRSLALMFGLGVHNLFEGLALGLQDSNNQFLNVLLGILIHEVLCAMAFGISLAQQRLRMRYYRGHKCVNSKV